MIALMKLRVRGWALALAEYLGDTSRARLSDATQTVAKLAADLREAEHACAYWRSQHLDKALKVRIIVGLAGAPVVQWVEVENCRPGRTWDSYGPMPKTYELRLDQRLGYAVMVPDGAPASQLPFLARAAARHLTAELVKRIEADIRGTFAEEQGS